MVGRYSRNPAFVNAIRLLIGVPHDDVLGRGTSWNEHCCFSSESFFGRVPICNTHGQQMVETDEFYYFARARVTDVIEDLS